LLSAIQSLAQRDRKPHTAVVWGEWQVFLCCKWVEEQHMDLGNSIQLEALASLEIHSHEIVDSKKRVPAEHMDNTAAVETGNSCYTVNCIMISTIIDAKKSNLWLHLYMK
jgi:hypothetical protein